MISIPTRMKYIHTWIDTIVSPDTNRKKTALLIYQNVCLSTTCADSVLLTYWFHEYLMRGNLWSNDSNCIWMFRVVQGPSLTNIGILPLNLLIRVIEYVLNKYFNRQYAFLNIYFKIFFGPKLAFGLTVIYSSQNQI